MIEDLARRAADDLRSATRSDVEAGLLDVYAAHRHHRRHTAAAVVATVVLALGAGWWGGQALTEATAVNPEPVGHPPVVVPPEACTGPVHCLGLQTYRIDLTRPVRWHIPSGYGVASGDGASDWLVESYADRQSDSGGGPYIPDTVAGVTVQEGVRVPSDDGATVRPGVADTPHAFVSWLAARPYLDASSVVPTRIDGRPAWRVRVTLKAGVGDGPAMCNGRFACYAITRTPDGVVTGIWGDMVADYTALRVPGAGTTVVWSWAFSRDRAALARNREVVRGISWPRA
jgi:hypothetical protein